MGKEQRDECGRFAQVREPWTPEAWDDGYVDNRGRFRVYRPDYPRAYALGYALRAHVVWWLAKGECHPNWSELHHCDDNRLNDAIGNLEPLTHSEHRKRHSHRATGACPTCGATFKKKDKSKKYCSSRCYHAAPKSEASREKLSTSLRRAYAEGRKQPPAMIRQAGSP